MGGAPVGGGGGGGVRVDVNEELKFLREFHKKVFFFCFFCFVFCFFLGGGVRSGGRVGGSGWM